MAVGLHQPFGAQVAAGGEQPLGSCRAFSRGGKVSESRVSQVSMVYRAVGRSGQHGVRARQGQWLSAGSGGQAGTAAEFGQFTAH